MNVVDESHLQRQYQYALHEEHFEPGRILENPSKLSDDAPSPPSLMRQQDESDFRNPRSTYLSGRFFYDFQAWFSTWFVESVCHPCRRLLSDIWPGMGLFGESYLLFSIGTLKPIWECLFPECFEYEICTPRLLHSLTYSVVLGAIVGMLSLGYLANSIGRRRGSIVTASLMGGGSIGLFLITFIPSPTWLYRSMSITLFFFGIGVGGEYPLSASSASEKAMQQLLRRQQLAESQESMIPEEESTSNDLSSRGDDEVINSRGRQVQLVFTMQGLGIWFNQVTMTVLLLLTGQTGRNNYSDKALMLVWRVTYLIGAVVLIGVLISRYLYLEESQVWADDKQRREQVCEEGKGAVSHHDVSADPRKSNPHEFMASLSTVSSLSNPSLVYDPYDETLLQHTLTDSDEEVPDSSLVLLLRNYGMRLFGASASWLLWDIAFYGNKLFQSTFLIALTGENTSLLEFTLAATINATVALFGYFGAAFLVDNPKIGRLRLQATGFLLTGMMFLLCGFLFQQTSSSVLVLMYMVSTFFGQLGPNATTFLVPSEIFPTEMRTLCHGFCAASGKVGALIAAVSFNYLKSDLDLFLLSGYACFLAAAVTIWTIPETTGMDILELDRLWRMTLEGKQRQYRGAAKSPSHCSMYERWANCGGGGRADHLAENIQLHDFS